MPQTATRRDISTADVGRDLRARAEALIPLLRQNAPEADRLRKLAPASLQAVREAGLLRVLQPCRIGGHELTLRDHVDIVATIARGCGSTGWCTGVYHAHSWLMGNFPQAAQDETYGANPDTIISAVISPRGTLRKQGDGYVLNGTWPFASGSQYSDWLLLGAVSLDDKGEVTDEADVLVATSAVTVKDDWNVVGLRGTGSCTVVAKDVPIPSHRYLSLRALIGGQAPGTDLHEGSLYRSAAVPVLAMALVPAALGIARHAMEAFTQRLPGREVAYTNREIQIEMPTTHMQVAQAATCIDVAEALLYRCADELQAAAESGGLMDFTKRARARADCAWAAGQCLEAVEILYLASGGSGIAEGSALGRAWRDLHAINMHGFLNVETNMEMYGRILLGLTPNTPLI